MALPSALLARFRVTRPRFEVPQERTLAWLAEAHARAEASIHGLDAADRAAFATRIANVLERCACGPSKISRRGVSIGELRDGEWDDASLYDLERHPHGKGTDARTRLYAAIVDDYFATAFRDERDAPDDLIHVTCTGYVSPSGAQQLVARRGWPTRVTHAYHMGCYAAVPAIRLAAGCIATGSERVDLAHTELCSLHLDPADHRIEQLVVQSLFADGSIRYTMARDDGGAGLRLRAIAEQILPDSAGSMTWHVSDHGMQMTLARDVPDRIGGALRAFVLGLYRQAGVPAERALRDSVFAVHPGGPKILDGVRAVLELDERQIATSRAVLFDHGNMSSATLPHIWARLLDDRAIPPRTLIPSLAFGPGLTVCGALFEKR